MEYELLIQHGDTLFQPAITEGIQWETERKNSPGKLTFKVLKSGTFEFAEGDRVRFCIDRQKIFYGFIFQKKRDKEGLITVTAYDQLRYLKNKDTISYENKTATEVIQMVAKNFNLQCGNLQDTGFKIEYRLEKEKTLFEMIQNALDLTLQNRTQMYVLYDDFGKLTLKNIADMKISLLIDETAGENFDYTSSIDGQTYNQIKLGYENENTGKREIFIAKDSSHINEWGVLQYLETIDDKSNGRAMADALLRLYNQKTRNLTVNGAFGDIQVRAGSLLPVSLQLGDTIINHFLMVEKVKHNFNEKLHTMDLTLIGGEFIA